MSNRTAPAPLCFRAQTCQLVTSVAVESGEAKAAIWQRIYERLRALYGVDVYTLRQQSTDSLLVTAERHDVLDKVYAIAYAELLYVQAYEE